MTAIVGAGTPEAMWRAWDALDHFPVLDLDRPPARVVVVAPHPDDEVMGVGGLAALLARAGSRVSIVAVTDGGGSHPGSPTLTAQELAYRRAAERTEALHRLGLGSASVHRLGVVDGEVAGAEDAVAGAVAQVLGRGAGDAWCLATWPLDGHPDHEATGRAAARACLLTGVRLLYYPVWAWHWAVPDDERVPWLRARRVMLPADVLAAKAAAVDAFLTQVRPLSAHPADAAILPPSAVARLVRPAEVILLPDAEAQWLGP